MIFNYFEIHITEHCNLNCQCCDNFSPIADEKYLDENSFQKDFERLNQLAGDNIHLIRLLGGEPTLHPNITFFFDTARKYFPNADIRLSTNGTRLTIMPEEFWQSCKDNRITVEITYYPIDIKKEKFMPIAESYNVEVIPFNNEYIEEKFSYRNPVNDTKKQNPELNYRSCYQAGHCVTLKSGKIYACTCIPNICHFNKYFNKNLEVTDKDYIDIYKVKDISEIEQFMDVPKPFCGYCNVWNRTNGIKWAVTKRELSEWFDEN